MVKNKTLSGLMLLLLSSTVMANGLLVEVFLGENQHPINIKDAGRMASVTIYDLSEPERIEDRISRSLSTDPVKAQQQAKKMLEENGQAITREFAAAYQGVLKAHGYELQKLPAIVFNNGSSVIYGELNVSKAIAIYNKSASRGR